MKVMTIYRYVMAIMKVTKIMIACVAIVSLRFLELKTARKMGQCGWCLQMEFVSYLLHNSTGVFEKG